MSHFDAAEKVWLGPKDGFHIDVQANFGDILLKKLAESDADRVIQVIIKFTKHSLKIVCLIPMNCYCV